MLAAAGRPGQVWLWVARQAIAPAGIPSGVGAGHGNAWASPGGGTDKRIWSTSLATFAAVVRQVPCWWRIPGGCSWNPRCGPWSRTAWRSGGRMVEESQGPTPLCDDASVRRLAACRFRGDVQAGRSAGEIGSRVSIVLLSLIWE